MPQQRLRHHNVVAVFDDLEAASDALDRLADAGFEPRGELSLLGPDHEMRPTIDRVTEGRGDAMTGLGKGLVVGGAAGATGGAVLMVLATAVAAIPGVGLALGTAVLYGIAIGGTGGGVVGALFGLEAMGRSSTMWQQTLSPLLRRVHADGVILVGVHVDDRERAEEAQRVLDEPASEVHLLSADIDYQPPQVEANVGDYIPSGAADAPGERQVGGSPPGEVRGH